ncbi:unnamed protein product [Menidia menidia]|uniref:(Atlantic silverside) hypothetical protein n=1 Tax=Menidia menidia TaxID=238744 RepID=A0A8S4B794_9TELE|nr:unnamed protein product [Menidia menidia]
MAVSVSRDLTVQVHEDANVVKLTDRRQELRAAIQRGEPKSLGVSQVMLGLMVMSYSIPLHFTELTEVVSTGFITAGVFAVILDKHCTMKLTVRKPDSVPPNPVGPDHGKVSNLLQTQKELQMLISFPPRSTLVTVWTPPDPLDSPGPSKPLWTPLDPLDPLLSPSSSQLLPELAGEDWDRDQDRDQDRYQDQDRDQEGPL